MTGFNLRRSILSGRVSLNCSLYSKTRMPRHSICFFVLVVLAIAAHGKSICQRLSNGDGKQGVFLNQFVTWSFQSFRNSETISPFFDGTALDRDGHNVTNYFGDQTLFKNLVESHVAYFGQLFNCTDSSLRGYTGPSMAAAHAKLKITASLFEQYELLAMETLPLLTFGKTTTGIDIEISQLFEKHRGVNAEDQICNSEDCSTATLTLDGWENLYPMFLNMESHQRSLTIINEFNAAVNFTIFNITSEGCVPFGSLVLVAANSNVTTSIFEDVPVGDYYFGKWPAICNLDVSPISPLITQIQLREPTIIPPVEAPVVSPVEEPIAPPVQAPVEPPSKAPVQAPVAPPTTPVGAPVQAPPPSSTPQEAPTSAPVAGPVNAPVESPVATPEGQENNERNLMPAVIILSIAVAILLGVVVFLVFKLKKKEPHYEIVND